MRHFGQAIDVDPDSGSSRRPGDLSHIQGRAPNLQALGTYAHLAVKKEDSTRIAISLQNGSLDVTIRGCRDHDSFRTAVDRPFGSDLGPRVVILGVDQ